MDKGYASLDEQSELNNHLMVIFASFILVLLVSKGRFVNAAIRRHNEKKNTHEEFSCDIQEICWPCALNVLQV